MRLFPILSLIFLLLSCAKPEHDIDKGIAEMEGIMEEEDTTAAVEVECLHDTSYYKLTMAALQGIPNTTDIRWIEAEHTAILNWRGAEVRRTRGGCDQFHDHLILTAEATTNFNDIKYWLKRAREAAKHFGIPYFVKAIDSGYYKSDDETSDHSTHFFEVSIPDVESDRVLEPIRIDDLGTHVRVTLRQYKM